MALMRGMKRNQFSAAVFLFYKSFFGWVEDVFSFFTDWLSY